MNRRQYMREYQRRWVKARKDAFFLGKRCVKCGSRKNLELDHVDPKTKITNSIWSWSEERRIEEIEKCQVLCHDCHAQKSGVERRKTGGPGTKWCAKHKKFLAVEMFWKNKSTWSGYSNDCRECATTNERRGRVHVGQRRGWKPR